MLPCDADAHHADKAIGLVAVIETDFTRNSRDADAIVGNETATGDEERGVFNLKIVNSASRYLPNVSNCDG